MHPLFIALVVAGFLAHFLSTFPVNHASRIAWGLWVVASVIWAVGRV